MKLKPSRSAAQNAKALLPKLAEKYFKAGRRAARAERTPKQLHNFRLRTKKFRYSLELFQPVYGAGLERHLNELHELQSTLGKLSDYHSVLALLKDDPKMEAKLERATRKKLKEFQDQWAAFDSRGQLKRWKSFLSK